MVLDHALKLEFVLLLLCTTKRQHLSRSMQASLDSWAFGILQSKSKCNSADKGNILGMRFICVTNRELRCGLGLGKVQYLDAAGTA